MNKLSIALLIFLGGCWYDRPNPWNTESDRAEYLDMKERDWLLELQQPFTLPQTPSAALTLAELEGWRGTVLVHADVAVLTHMRDESVRKTAGLETRLASMAPLNENNKIQIYELLWQARVEKVRLQMIEDTLAQAQR